jgi:predicted phosphodiesterase
MKIKLLSDLHLDHAENTSIIDYYTEIVLSSGDLLILAGDILTVKHLSSDGLLKNVYISFFRECSKRYDKIIYVMGNHEHFGYNCSRTLNKIQEFLPNNFYLLENQTLQIDNWNFIGFTLWTDFNNANPLDMINASSYMKDYKAIRITDRYRKFRPEDSLALHRESLHYLKEQLNLMSDNVFVISHHTPSYRSVPPKFIGNHHNSAYCTSLDELIMDSPQIKYWAHGHTHWQQDYYIEQCRVLCNPHGYHGQTTEFNPNFELEI